MTAGWVGVEEKERGGSRWIQGEGEREGGRGGGGGLAEDRSTAVCDTGLWHGF